ncbi:MAG: FxsA family protein [Planctomycetia bacterium]
MRNPLVFLLALLALPFVELAVLLKLGSLTDWRVPLLAVVVMTGVGIVLIRSIGWLTFRQFQEELEHRRVPGNAILNTLCLFLAGLLFLFPGLVTDILGLLLLIPPTRFLVKRAVVSWITTGVRNAHVKVRVTVDGGPFTVVDGEDVAVAQTQPSLPVERPRLPAPVEPPEEPRPETR